MNISPDFDAFARNRNVGKHQVVWTRFISDLETPVSAMLKLCEARPYSFLLESIEGGAIRGRYSIIGRDPDLIWRCRDGKAEVNRNVLFDDADFRLSERAPIEDLRVLIDECRIDDPDHPKPMAAGLFGYLGYDMIRYLERIPESPPSDVDVPESVFIRPTLLAIFDQIENCFTLVTPVWFNAAHTAEVAYQAAVKLLETAVRDLGRTLHPHPVKNGTPPVSCKIDTNMDESQFVTMVERSKEYIRAGDIFQVVLSQRFKYPFESSAFDLYRAVRRLDPSPFLFYFDFKGFAVVGSSPEILVRVRDGKIVIRPIAGTRPRGDGNRTDSELAVDLLSDPKELAEHLMLVDLGRNDVGRFAKTGTVKVTERNTIEYYRHVMHIVSNVEGELDPQYSALDALIGGFPAGTVSGAPKIRAMEIIAELEPDRRGIYAGCVGYFGANGNLDTCIAIRTAVVKDGYVHVQAGAGIVYDSDPFLEYRESVAKSRGMLKAAEIALIEK